MLINNDNNVDSSIAYFFTVSLCILWLIIIIFAPLLYKLPHNFVSIADMYYYILSITCHQQPSRCYWLFDYQLPVCVRCFGIYFGFFVGLVLYPLIKNIRSLNLPAKKWLFICIIPIAIDGTAQLLKLYPSPHWLRLLTGMLSGYIAAFYIIPAFNEVVKIFSVHNKP